MDSLQDRQEHIRLVEQTKESLTSNKIFNKQLSLKSANKLQSTGHYRGTKLVASFLCAKVSQLISLMEFSVSKQSFSRTIHL